MAEPWPALGVAGRAVVRRDDGRILLIRRASHLSTDPGTWELPGGKMDYGETLTETVAREVLEETGLSVNVIRPIHLCHFTKDPFWVTCVTFLCDYAGGDVRLSEENDEFVWVEASEIPERTYARTIREQLDAYVSAVAARHAEEIRDSEAPL